MDTTKGVAKKKETTNLKPAEPKKNLIKNINRTYSTDLPQTFYRLEKSYFYN